MKGKQGTYNVCIIDITNKQESYAACLELIKCIEKGTEEKLSDLLEDKLEVRIGKLANKIAVRYIEQPISYSERNAKKSGEVQDVIEDIEIVSIDMLQNTVFFDSDTYYHIRIHLSERNINEEIQKREFVNFQYLALLLIYLERIFFSKKILAKTLSVFVVPVTGKKYPFEDQDGNIDIKTYTMVSKYLRLLSNQYKGIIYGVTRKKGNIVVASLDFKEVTTFESYFPVILVDDSKYESLFYQNIRIEELDKLFEMQKRGRFGDSRNENPDYAIRDIVLEMAYKHMFEELEKAQTKELSVDVMKKVILEKIKSGKGISVTHFCLFIFMLCLDASNDLEQFRERMQYAWNIASDVFQGIRQVVQNSLQHSQYKNCIFTFCLHRNGINESKTEFTKRISQIYSDTEFHRSNSKGQYEALEIFVSDINEDKDVIETFKKNLEEEITIWNKQGHKELEGHRELLQSDLSIRNLFSEYENDDCIDAWLKFRKQDIVAHVGLSLLKLTTYHCNASVKMISSKRCVLQNESHYFYKPYSATTKRIYRVEKDSLIIPGTQVSLLIPVNDWSEKKETRLGKNNSSSYMIEDYRSFASYIEYKEKREQINLTSSNGNNYTDILSPSRKNNLVKIWAEKFWTPKLIDDYKSNERERKIYCFDFSLISENLFFKNDDNIEVMIKGLISTLGKINYLENFYGVSLINLPPNFIEQFCRLSALMGVRIFPTNFQLFMSEIDLERKIILAGENLADAIYNSYVYSIEHGSIGYRREDCIIANELRNVLMSVDETSVNSEKKGIRVFPFDAVITIDGKEGSLTLFEVELKKVAEKSIGKKTGGYKIAKTHMRLGSKVHIESFYEMSFLFYRTTIANRIAFIILRNINMEMSATNLQKKDDDDITLDLLKDNIIFYGYASYSKAILTSVTEILKLYRDDEMAQKVAFISYQHNTQTESAQIQIYYDLGKGFPGNLDGGQKLCLNEPVKLVQIVPISSTLTTFDKMWLKLEENIHKNSINKVSIYGNYTIFWVVDSNGNLDIGKPSAIESKFWETVNKKNIVTRFVSLKAHGNNNVKYFINSMARWHDPLECELCYPVNTIDEIPLIETDATSTVPTQQIRTVKHDNGIEIEENNRYLKDNNSRLKMLKDCVLYGHICRRQNHYQYYIETQKFFYKVKKDVETWLISLQDVCESKSPVLNIIFSPEHNTNVGFAQYINTYYFNGTAEIISLNVDKEFRSNFICEHMELITLIEHLHMDVSDIEETPIKFFFVDDTIITGETFEKANSFLHSLLPENVRRSYPAVLFEKVFLLVDRLSDETKSIYVKDIKKDFLSFVHIDISNVRTQGDSCIGCKLEKNAWRMYKRSATNALAEFWGDKIEKYSVKPYDDESKLKNIDRDDSYNRLVISHCLQNILVKKSNMSESEELYDKILNLCLWMLDSTGHKQECEAVIYDYKQLLNGINGLKGIKIVLKTISRPFFSYDFKIRNVVMTFLVLITNFFIEKTNEVEVSKSKIFLSMDGRKQRTYELMNSLKCCIRKENGEEIEFLKNYLIEGLTDIGSTYIMRKETMRYTYQYVEKYYGKDCESQKIDFWNCYVANIQRLITNNADETKELWLEYLYVCGMEYMDFIKQDRENKLKKFEPHFIYETITGKENVEVGDEYFYCFCHEVFLQNIGINYDVHEKHVNKHVNKQVNDEYFMESWRKMRSLHQFMTKKDINLLASEYSLFKLIDEKREYINKTPNSNSKYIDISSDVEEWYKKLLENIGHMINEKYNISEDNINIAIVTENKQYSNKDVDIEDLIIIKQRIYFYKNGISAEKYDIKNRIVNALNEKDELPFKLKKYGYTICEKGHTYIILMFNNLDVESEGESGRSIKAINRVFLYIGIDKVMENKEEDKVFSFVLRMILRDILTYRNRILSFLVNDFTGGIFSRYARKSNENNILSHEKANSHNTTADDEITIEMFVKPNVYEEYTVLNEQEAGKWLLLRNYTNGQIAKIFNKIYSSDLKLNEKEQSDEPPLYITSDIGNCERMLFGQRLKQFCDLGIVNDEKPDLRFELLKKVVEIEWTEDVFNAEFISREGKYYNLEYFKCILVDIFISAIKYKSIYPDYLLRIDNFLYDAELIKKEKISDSYKDKLRDGVCVIKLYREKIEDSNIDYLVIMNSVNKGIHKLECWKMKNEEIKRRLADPLDYVDGHMSLLTIKRYIESLHGADALGCQFEYIEIQNELYFVTKLPILKE